MLIQKENTDGLFGFVAAKEKCMGRHEKFCYCVSAGFQKVYL